MCDDPPELTAHQSLLLIKDNPELPCLIIFMFLLKYVFFLLLFSLSIFFLFFSSIFGMYLNWVRHLYLYPQRAKVDLNLK